MTEQEMVNYIRDWFPIGDPHFVNNSDCLDCWCDECNGCPNTEYDFLYGLAGVGVPPQ